MLHDQAYLKAEEKIQEALKSDAKSLYLPGIGLSELPVSIGELKDLQHLDLGIGDLFEQENDLAALPESLGQLYKLETLILSGNKLTILPECVGKLTQLRLLDLSYNQLTSLPEFLGKLTHLQHLNLSHNQLTALPGWLGGRTQLTDLDLSSNQLIALPDSLGQLTQLTNLDLSHNQLTALPNSLGQLTQLTGLNLSSNQLTALLDSLGQLTQLTNLDLSHNQLTALPNSLGQLTKLTSLDPSSNQLTALPDSLGQLTQLTELNLSRNQLTTLPDTIGQLFHLKTLKIASNKFATLPDSLGLLKNLETLYIYDVEWTAVPDSIRLLTQLKELTIGKNKLTELPEWIGNLSHLRKIYIAGNEITSLPESIGDLQELEELWLSTNPEPSFIDKLPDSISGLQKLRLLGLSRCKIQSLPNWIADLPSLQTLFLDPNILVTELAEAYEQGLEAVKLYLRAGAVVRTYEAKLILVGEGEVGKTCLMDALLGKEWQEHPSTHGIEIQQIKITFDHLEYSDDLNEVEDNSEDEEDNDYYMAEEIEDLRQNTVKEITLNGWDFGGQRVYRPTHQLFFSAPAVYLVVWKPREGPQQGFVKEWIQLIKRREPSAKILVVVTHGGPGLRQPDIDRQELWDIFGKDTVIDFFFVDSKPDEQGNRKGIAELKEAIARVAATLPEVGRSVPKSFADARTALQAMNKPYLPFDEVLAICHTHNMDDEIARLFITISHRLGHLTHYENDPALRDIVILRPDWLANAMSYVLDDEETRKAHGLVDFSRLGHLWDDPTRPVDTRYPDPLHRIFLRLMERFDLSYRVAGLSKDEEANPVSLIAQLVPDVRPDNLAAAWSSTPASGDIQQTQICRIVDEKGQSATAEGLFYQLIVRLHKYSLGRLHYKDSVHWQRGLVLDDDYNGRALLENIGNDVRITVRAPYPERFLAMLTAEVKYLVENFWEGLNCDVMVPCIEPCGRKAAGTGLYEVEKLIDSKKKGRPEFPCPVCNEWENIDSLLRNAPAAAQPISLFKLLDQFEAIKDKLDVVDVNTRRILSQVDKAYTDLLQILTDEAKEGPRLFSLFPLEGSKFNPKTWVRAKFRLVLWCEHSRLPLPVLNNGDMKKGVYDLELEREWFKKAAPYLQLMTGTLSLVLPVASSALKVVNDTAIKTLEDQIDLGKEVIDAVTGEAININRFMTTADSTDLEHGVAIRAENATLRELHAMLKAKDPSFGGLVRVINKRQEFLWVHEKFASEY